MTTTDLAAALNEVSDLLANDTASRLFGVSRSTLEPIAALSRALDPAIAEQAKEVQKDLKLFRAVWGELPSVAPHIATAPGVTTGSVISACDRAASLITALLTANAALRAERDTVLGMYMRSSEEGFRQKDRAEAAEAEVEKLQRDLNDTTAVAENYTNLVRCKGGRIRNAGNSGYVCFICGADTSIGEKCRAALTTEEGHE